MVPELSSHVLCRRAPRRWQSRRDRGAKTDNALRHGWELDSHSGGRRAELRRLSARGRRPASAPRGRARADPRGAPAPDLLALQQAKLLIRRDDPKPLRLVVRDDGVLPARWELWRERERARQARGRLEKVAPRSAAKRAPSAFASSAIRAETRSAGTFASIPIALTLVARRRRQAASSRPNAPAGACATAGSTPSSQVGPR